MTMTIPNRLKMNLRNMNMREVGRKMEEMVQKGIIIIRSHSHNPIPVMKLGYGQAADDTPDDFATQGDTEAQRMYFDCIVFDPDFGGIGIIGEEGLNHIFKDTAYDAYFTCDPLDGTKAYARRQSNGVGTMLALVVKGYVIAAYIGDANTGEIFGFAHNINKKGERLDTFTIEPFRRRFDLPLKMQKHLDVENQTPLNKRFLSLREAPHKQVNLVRQMIGELPINGAGLNPLFKDIDVTGGSVGLHLAKLWKGEVGAVILNNDHVTPWDHTPLIGFNHALGFITYKYDEKKDNFFRYEPTLTTEVVHDQGDQLIVHGSYAEAIDQWLKMRNDAK